ncbi:pyrimidine 5'-nucleotidase-domain-containing protein, partial [Ochromonadaceae sp. CCMP2298]
QYFAPVPAPVPVDPSLSIPLEPQVFAHGGAADCLVIVPRPRELFRKKREVAEAGPEKLQVFADFEHVMTAFGTADGERALGSAELLESSGAVRASALLQLGAIADDFEHAEYMDHAAFQDLAIRCQQVVATEGALHIASVAPVVRDTVSKMGLREGWAQALQSLSLKGVPTYIFSSGYGDVVAQAILQALTTLSGGALLQLPQNLRIVSNFFRTAPDGTVRAFSQPVVHERNKNATTAEAQMGFPVLQRPYALVLGSHEDDVQMTDGVALKQQISIGFLELSEDLAQRLPVYLSAFDAVVVGDGSFQYVRSVVDDLLKITAPVAPASGIPNAAGLAMGLRNRFGALLNPLLNPAASQSQPQPQQQYQQYQPQQYQQPQYQPAAPAPDAPYGKSYMDFTEF